MNKNSKIYLAGHRGLVGSALKNNLVAKGYKNIITRTHKELDLSNQFAVAEFFKVEKPEYVLLAAAKVGGIVANNTYRADFIYENLMIQNNVIHQSFVHGVKKLLFLGSTCIYPKNCPQPMKEEYLLTDTLEYTNEPYAIAKIAGIKMCESYNLQYDTNYIAVQPTNLYGPNDNFDLEKSHVLPALIRKIHLGKALENNDWEILKKDLNHLPIEGVSGKSSKEEIEKILSKYGVRYSDQNQSKSEKLVEVEIWGSGKPLREFLWSEDMADACVHLMENVDFKDIISFENVISSGVEKPLQPTTSNQQPTTKQQPATNNQQPITNTHINIGTGKEISIKELAETIKKAVGFQGNLYFNADKPDGTLRKLTDSSKLENLGWKYKVELSQGIQQMYAWYCDTK
jgi:GDP-L-fucose synthase